MTLPPRSHPVRDRLRVVLAYRDVRTLAAVFLAGQLLDVITTERALSTHRFREGNPWLAEVTHAHPFLVYGAKLFIGVLVLLALLLLRLRWKLRLAVLTAFCVASLSAPAANLLRIVGWL